MAIRRPPTTFSDTISTGDIADDAISGDKLANDIAISTTGNIATTGSGTLTVAGNTTLSGTNNLGSNPTITLGSNTTFPAGHILQVVSNNIGSQTNVQATTFNTADVIGNCQITPKKASSNILIIASITAQVNTNGDYMYLDIYKNASDVTETANLSTKIGLAVQDNDHWSNLFITFLDTCAENSLTEKTYKVSGRLHAAGIGYLGWTTGGTFQENITAYEIAT